MTKSKQQDVAIDDKLDKNIVEKPGPLLHQMSVSSNQPSTSRDSRDSSNKIITDRIHRGSSSSNAQNSRTVYVEPNDEDKDHSKTDSDHFGNNTMKLSGPSPNHSARMDVNTLIITIPASSLNCSSLHGKGLLISPMNSARRDSMTRGSPSNSTRNPLTSPRNSFRGPPSSHGGIQTPPASSRRNSMENNNVTLPTIHSALNFAELEANLMLSQADDEYGVGFIDTSSGRHTSSMTAY